VRAERRDAVPLMKTSGFNSRATAQVVRPGTERLATLTGVIDAAAERLLRKHSADLVMTANRVATLRRAPGLAGRR
jgi:hypothetical protein